MTSPWSHQERKSAYPISLMGLLDMVGARARVPLVGLEV